MRIHQNLDFDRFIVSNSEARRIREYRRGLLEFKKRMERKREIADEQRTSERVRKPKAKKKSVSILDIGLFGPVNGGLK